MIGISEAAGGHVINGNRMWHYTEDVKNWDPIWPAHGIRILPGPSSMWFDAKGERLAPLCFPGFDTPTTLREMLKTGYEYSWFVLTQKAIKKEFTLSGSEQNPDFTSKSWGEAIRQRILSGSKATGSVEAFKERGEDFVEARPLPDLIRGMHRLDGGLVDGAWLTAQIEASDAQVDNPFTRDAQLIAIHAARNYRGDRLIRTAPLHKLLDPANGPLIAVKLHVLTRKTLGRLQTNLESQMIGADGQVCPGFLRPERSLGLEAAGITVITRLRARFWAGVSFPVGMRGSLKRLHKGQPRDA